ncbi:uncharacterized protein N7482_002460 [Penicillium canariense]|uniref:LITAF domain-containing protein n=1 Tax=Penicillium canariense TaxID=189055 RepID=A0A9W9LTX7_9EURO|nr:uncharacterized protein N7482_002460 [Penicillium canariense]KAJ5176583.1 hypothetical protein N7482_002460 [Penicillium canariense]
MPDAPATTATAITSPPADKEGPAITAESQPPRYEEQDKEVMPAPAPAPAVASITTSSAPIEKTAWESAIQAQPAPPGQGLVVQKAVNVNQLGEEPRLVNCPFCNREGDTRVNKESMGATGMAAVCCCLFGGIICAFLPYCMEMCHDSHHFCTNCGQKVAAIRPHDGQVQVFSPHSPVVTAPGHVQPPQAVAMSHRTSGKI